MHTSEELLLLVRVDETPAEPRDTVKEKPMGATVSCASIRRWIKPVLVASHPGRVSAVGLRRR